MADVRTWIIVVLAIAVAVFALDGDAAQPDPHTELKTDELIERTRAAGFFVYESDPAQEVSGLIAGLQEDTGRIATALREQQRQNDLLQGSNRALALAATNAMVAIDDLQGVVDSLSATGDPISVTAELEDPIIDGWLRFWYATQSFDADLRPHIDLALSVTEAADGRMLFSAIPEDARVTATITGAAWTPPPPVYQCTVRQQLRAGAVGGGIVGALAAIAALAGG